MVVRLKSLVNVSRVLRVGHHERKVQEEGHVLLGVLRLKPQAHSGSQVAEVPDWRVQGESHFLLRVLMGRKPMSRVSGQRPERFKGSALPSESPQPLHGVIVGYNPSKLGSSSSCQ